MTDKPDDVVIPIKFTMYRVWDFMCSNRENGVTIFAADHWNAMMAFYTANDENIPIGNIAIDYVKESDRDKRTS